MPARGVVCANGEEQLAAVSGVWTQDEDCVPVLKLRIALLEQASTRYMKLFFLTPETVRIELSEQPSKQALADGVSFVSGASRLLAAAGGERLQTQLDTLAEPVLFGHLVSEQHAE